MCNLCGKSFSQKNTLQVHMAKHTGAKPYQCPVCETKFTQKGISQLVGFVTMTTIAPVTTWIWAAFLGNMKTHIKRAHPDQTIIHNIEELAHEEQQVVAEADESLQDADDVIATAAATMDTEPDDGQYELQLYNI